MEIFSAEPSVREEAGAAVIPPFRSEIRFEGLRFRYPEQGSPGRWVLDGVDFSVRAGEVVAMVGSSGAGKSTLVNLLLRFYDPVEGRITLDGLDLRRGTLRSLRDQIALVTQEPFLFHDSIRTNIAFARPEAALDQVTAAARAANADSFIRRLPVGYDTQVGDLGYKLSGGERQRIAIARALLKNAPILILDEATSQLDSESEGLVQEALERLMEGRTALVIAHRFSTIRRADRIVVLDKGRITQIGRHEELLEGSALYRRLHDLQVAP
jgi:ATP-binding cassette, subfamily B, bacterial MsbA